MSAPKWWQGRMVGLDTETTGKDPHTVRIITAATVLVTPGAEARIKQWLIHPQTDIPTEASDVHGWTIDRIEAKLQGHEALATRADGTEDFVPRDAALNEIAIDAGFAMAREVPLVVHNAPYDLTLLEAELARNGVDSLTSRPAGIHGVIDPMVLEQNLDPFRKHCYKAAGCKRDERHHECSGCRGGLMRWDPEARKMVWSKVYDCGGCGSTDRTLTSLCNHYQLVLDGAHDAAADTLAALRLAWRLGSLSPEFGSMSLQALHRRQIEWRRDQQLKMKTFFASVGKPTDDFCPEWPLHTRCATTTAVA